jgi:hypothetical protein
MARFVEICPSTKLEHSDRRETPPRTSTNHSLALFDIDLVS